MVVACPPSSTVVGHCPYGCNRPGDFGPVNFQSLCNPPPDGGTDGAAGSGGQGGGGGGAGGSGGCPPSSDPVSWSCVNGDVTTHVACTPPQAPSVGACPYGCKYPVGFGFFNASSDCNAAPDGGTDAPFGTFVMCDDHADFNGRGRCAATGKVGAVFALQKRGAASTVTTLTAVFGTTTPPSEAGCTRATVGASCTAVTCSSSAPPPVTGTEAGPITAKSNGGALVTDPGAGGAYDVAPLARALWSLPKTALAFSAAGGATPAFGETFCGPPPVSLTKPAGAPGALTIDRAADLAVQWPTTAVGDLEFVLRDDTTSATSTVEVQCFFVGASGQGTVPKAALAKIGPGAHTIASYLWVRKIGLGSGTCVELTGIQTNDSSTPGAPFNGTATFQ
jgi:hypothetical protein